MNNQTITAILFTLPLLAVMSHLLLARCGAEQLRQGCQIVYCMMLVVLSSLLLRDARITVIQVANWLNPFGISLVIDTLAKLMLLIFSIVIFAITLYSQQDRGLKQQSMFYYIGQWLMILGLIGTIVTYDIFNLYVWSEVMLVSAIILLNSGEELNVTNIYHYAIFNIIGTLIMLLAIALLYGITGQLNFAAIAQYSATHSESFLILPSMILLMIGLSIKGGIFPFYFWLPDAYPSTSTSSTLLLSSMVTKVIMLVMLRLVWMWTPLQSIHVTSTFAIIASFTMFFGVMGAANQYRIHEILSFHIVSQLGYILLAIFIPSFVAITATIYFTLHNILIKSSLLMTAGIVKQQYGTDDVREIGHILKNNPLLSSIFFLSAMSLAGIPPLSGFWGKLFVMQAAFEQQYYFALIVSMVVSLFTLYSMIKIWRHAYCQGSKTASETSTTQALSIMQMLALAPLLILPIIIGLYPNSLLPLIKQAAIELQSSTKTLSTIKEVS